MSHWQRAMGTDIDHMVALTKQHFESEADTIFSTDPLVLARNLTRAVVDQFYNPGTACLWLLRDQDQQIQAYVWAERGQRACWSDDEMVAIKIVHVDLALPVRQRLTICDEILCLVEAWAASIDVMIVCSTTMRNDQEGFLRLHERRGYDRRGSICYKRLQQPAAQQHTDHAGHHTDQCNLR